MRICRTDRDSNLECHIVNSLERPENAPCSIGGVSAPEGDQNFAGDVWDLSYPRAPTPELPAKQRVRIAQQYACVILPVPIELRFRRDILIQNEVGKVVIRMSDVIKQQERELSVFQCFLKIS